MAVAFFDPRDLFEEDGRGKRLADVPPLDAAALEAVQLDAEGRIVGFSVRDKLAALDELAAMLQRANRKRAAGCRR